MLHRAEEVTENETLQEGVLSRGSADRIGTGKQREQRGCSTFLGARRIRLWRPCGRLRRSGPASSAIFAKSAADEQNDGKDQALNDWRRQHNRLCVPMPPQYMGQVEDGRPAGQASVENRKDRLQVAIQVICWGYPAT
jgi:hypothetical protein